MMLFASRKSSAGAKVGENLWGKGALPCRKLRYSKVGRGQAGNMISLWELEKQDRFFSMTLPPQIEGREGTFKANYFVFQAFYDLGSYSGLFYGCNNHTIQ